MKARDGIEAQRGLNDVFPGDEVPGPPDTMPAHVPIKTTDYGFAYGPVEVIRACSDPSGAVLLTLETKRERLDVHVTPTGFIRVQNVVKHDGRLIGMAFR